LPRVGLAELTDSVGLPKEVLYGPELSTSFCAGVKSAARAITRGAAVSTRDSIQSFLRTRRTAT
jgi:hypothetical protein